VVPRRGLFARVACAPRPGRSDCGTCAELASSHPECPELIWAGSSRSEEMVGSVDAGSVEVLRAVRETGLPCYAPTIMEAETYPLRLERLPFLGWFDGTVVSGREGVAKPEPAIFTRLLDRFGLAPNTTLMIDDTEENLEAARKLGIQTVLFRSSRHLRAELEAVGVLSRSGSAASMEETGHHVDHEGNDHRPEHVREQSVRQRNPPNPLGRQIGVRYLERHANGQG
jgi:hypothetical protein